LRLVTRVGTREEEWWGLLGSRGPFSGSVFVFRKSGIWDLKHSTFVFWWNRSLQEGENDGEKPLQFKGSHFQWNIPQGKELTWNML